MYVLNIAKDIINMSLIEIRDFIFKAIINESDFLKKKVIIHGNA